MIRQFETKNIFLYKKVYEALFGNSNPDSKRSYRYKNLNTISYAAYKTF